MAKRDPLVTQAVICLESKDRPGWRRLYKQLRRRYTDKRLRELVKHEQRRLRQAPVA